MADTPKPDSKSSDLTQESDWHRRISEAAYFRAEQRGFHGAYSLDDWLAAEREVRDILSPEPAPPQAMTDPIRTPEPAVAREPTGPVPSKIVETPNEQQVRSNFAKFAATQASADGLQGDARKKGKSVDEKIGANMADRK